MLLILLKKAVRLFTLFVGLLIMASCGGFEGTGAPASSGADSGLSVSGRESDVSLAAREVIQGRLAPADQVPTPSGTDQDFTQMPLHGFKAISADGNQVLFLSTSANPPGVYQLYLRDRVQGTTELISQNAAGEIGNGDTTYGALSADGNVVVFASEATNLDGNSPGGNLQIYVRNRAQSSTRLLNSASFNASGDSVRPSISGDGSVVVFESRNPALTGDTEGRAHILTADVATGAVTVLTSGNAGDSQNPDISRDGRWVVFNSKTTAGAVKQIVRVDLTALGAAPQIISAQSGRAGDRDSFNPTVNADGSVVAFETLATNLVPGGDDFKVVAWNGSLHLVSGNGGANTSPAHLASLSDDGRFVGFVSTSVGLPDTTLGPQAVANTRTFVHRLDTGATALVSQTETQIGNGVDVIGNGDDIAAVGGPLAGEIGRRDGETAVSGNGTVIAYTSFSDNLGGTAQGDRHVYVSVNPLFGASLRFSPNPPFAAAAGGQSFSVTVEALDEAGAVDPSFNGPVTLSAQGDNVSLSGQVSVNAVQGVATFNNLSLSGPPQSGVTLTASTGTTSPYENAVSNPFTLDQSALTFVTNPPGTGQVFPAGSIGNGETFQVAVETRGPDGQVDTSFTGPVTLSLVLPDNATATLNGVLTQNAMAGVATFPGLTITGPPTTGLAIQANAGGTFGQTVSAPFELTAIPAGPGGGFLGVTTDGGNSLNLFRSDNQTGALTPGPTITIPLATALEPWNLDSPTQPRFLVVATQADILTSVGVDRATGNMTILDSLPTLDAPVDIEVFNDSVAFVVYNGDNSIQAFPLDKATGAISPAVQTVVVGDGPLALKYVDVPGTMDFVLVANRDSNTISVLRWDTIGGILTTVPQPGGPAKPNLLGADGLRGITAGPLTAAGTIFGVWAGNVLTANVSAFTLNPVTGELSDVATTSAAGPGTGSPIFTGLDAFLYVVNNVTDNLNSYTVDLATGDLMHLAPATGIPTEGATPDQIIEAISITGPKFLYVGNNSFFDQATRNVNGWVRNADGSLTQIPGLPLALPGGVSRVGYIPSN